MLVAAALAAVFTLSARGTITGEPVEIIVNPSVIEQTDDATATIKTQVRLRQPSPCYFICEVRSADPRQLACRDIIFKKGDLTATGTATVDWSEVTESTTLEVSAFSVDAPDKRVIVKVTLQKKDDSSP